MRKILISMHDSAHAEIHHFVEHANRAQTEIKFSHVRLPDSAKNVLFTETLEAEAGCKEAYSLRRYYKLGPSDSLLVVVEGNIRDMKDDEYFIVNGVDHSATDELAAGIALISLYYLNPNSDFRKKGEGWWDNLSEFERKRIAADSILLLILAAVASEFAAVEYHDDVRGCIMDYCQTPIDIIAALKGGFQFCDEVCTPILEENALGRSLLAIAKQLTTISFRFRRLPTGEFDVVFFYNPESANDVRATAARLKERGLEPWLDAEQRRPGFSWQWALEQHIEKIRAAAVFVGEDGVGPWRDSEIEAFIRRFVKRGAPVIPVILAGAKKEPALPALLEGRTWVDFRSKDPDPVTQMFWGITGALAPAGAPLSSNNASSFKGSAGAPPIGGDAVAGPAAHSNLVISLHGIRTRGAWQKELDTELAQGALVPKALDYGFFGVIRLLIPSSRQKQVEWFREKYTSVVRENQVQKPSIIAHSLGTYLVASAMDLYDEIEFDHVIFCGSIVNENFEWSRFVNTGRINRLLNDCGERDRWVKLAKWVIVDAGLSGVSGFHDRANGKVLERRHTRFRHSDYFYALNFQKNWVPFLKGGELSETSLGRKRPTNWKFVIVKIAAFALLIGMLAWVLYKFLGHRFF